MSEAEHILVLGVPRSGTTLLSAAVGAHSRVCMLDEFTGNGFRFITGGKIKGVKLCVPNQIALSKKWKPWYSLPHSNGFVRKNFVEARFPLSRLSIRDYRRFASLRIIVILRDPDSVVSSIMRRANRRKQVAVRLWTMGMETFDVLEREQTSTIRFVDFDKFVVDPRETLESLCEFLGIAFEDRMLRAHEFSTYYASDSFNASKANPNSGNGTFFPENRIPENAVDIFNRLKKISV